MTKLAKLTRSTRKLQARKKVKELAAESKVWVPPKPSPRHHLSNKFTPKDKRVARVRYKKGKPLKLRLGQLVFANQ